MLAEWKEKAANVERLSFGEGEVVLDAFGGMAALLLALARLGRKLAAYFIVDMDPVCGILAMYTAEYCMRNMPDVVSFSAVAHMFDLWGDVNNVGAGDLVERGPFTIFGCGSPCQGFSRASGRPGGWADPRSQLLLEGVRLRDDARALAEPWGVSLQWYFENVDMEEHLPEISADIDEITGTRGVAWNGGRLEPSHRLRRWWVNPEMEYAPPPFEGHEPTLADALRRCGGWHYPRIAPYTDPPGLMDVFNIRGQVMVKAPTVMAAANTISLQPPPWGSGAGLHHNATSGELEPLMAFERFALMSWPVEIAHASTRHVSEMDRRHAIGNGMSVRALEWWGIHLPPWEERVKGWPDPSPLRNDGQETQAEKAPPDSASDRANETGVPVDSGKAEAAEDEHAVHDELQGHDNQEADPTAGTGEEAVAPPEESPESDGFTVPEESGFAEQDGGQFDVHIQKRLREAAKEGRAREFDPIPAEEELREGVRKAMREIRTSLRTPDDELMRVGTAALAAEILEIRAKCLDPGNFQAARYHLHYAAWDEMCEELWRMGLQNQKRTPEQKKVLRDIREGARPKFWDISRGFDEGHPSFTRKFKCIFRDLIDMGYSDLQASKVLSGTEPKMMHFKNRPSIREHIKWVTDAVVDLLQQQGARIWDELPYSITGGEPPWVISPLSVAIREKDGKKRLCIDLRYFNLWLQYMSVRFDGIRDLAAMVDEMQNLGATEVVVCLSDMKAGYLHCPLAPEVWKYFCFELGGVVMCYTVLNFGFAQSPRLYCSVEGLKHSVYRTLGVQLVEYIDDSARPYQSTARSLATEKLLLRLGTLLGGYYSFGEMTRGPKGEVFFEKMQLWPERKVEFLGFMMDLEKREVSIPQKKMDYILRRVGEWEAQGAMSTQDLARLAGLLVSIQPAIPISKALAHQCFRAISGAGTWREAFPTPEYVQQLLQWLMENLAAWNGQHWYKYPAGIAISGDYSPNGTGGIIFSVKLEDGEPQWKSAPRDMPIDVVASFSPEERQLLIEGSMSSALGELVATRHLLRVAIEEAPEHLIRGRTIIYLGDGEAPTAALNKLYSPVESMQAVVLDCHGMVLAKGGRLEAEWIPRDENWWADHNSKIEDSSAWELNWPDTKWVWRQLLKHDVETSPTLDAWADSDNKKVKLFISRWICPGAVAVDARRQGALMASVYDKTGRKHLVWINPPFSLWGDVVRQIKYYKIDCIIIYPAWRGEVTREIERLPIVGGIVEIPHHKHMFKPGTRVPAAEAASGPRFKVKAALVRWPRTRE